MYIKDYEFISDIGGLFQKEVIIYGAGRFGKRSAQLLQQIGVDVCCFCDRDSGKKQYLGRPVIGISALEKLAGEKDCLVVIGSIAYCEEIAEEMRLRQIRAFVCTWYGLQAGVELQIRHKRIPEQFATDFLRRKEVWRDYVRLRGQSILHVALCCMQEPVLVYQPAKVASSTVYQSLRAAHKDAVHLHWIFTDGMRGERSCGKWGLQNHEMLEMIGQIRRRNHGLKIITAVREPVSRALSDFMEGFSFDFISGCDAAPVDMQESGASDAAASASVLERNAYQMVLRFLEEDYEFQWFDRELKQLTGVDIFAHPFDREHGYAWIREDDIEILVLKVEKLDENADVLAAFAGLPQLRLVNENRGAGKHYKYIYEGLKQHIQIPQRLLERQYQQNPRMDHFYTEEEKAVFMQKWQKNRRCADE